MSRYAIEGLVVEDLSRRPLSGVGIVARAPDGEILASGRSDDTGVFRLRVAPAALRGLRWGEESELELTVLLDRAEQALELAGMPEVWRLSDGPSEAVTVRVRPASDDRKVIPFAPRAADDEDPPRQDVLVATMVLGLSVSLRHGTIDHEQARRWLFNADSHDRLKAQGVPDDVLALVRRGIALEHRPERPGADAAAALEHEALACLRALADRDQP